MSKLLPCPFCGGKPQLLVSETRVSIWCRDCHSQGKQSAYPFGCDFSPLYKEAIKKAKQAWNTRFNHYTKEILDDGVRRSQKIADEYNKTGKLPKYK